MLLPLAEAARHIGVSESTLRRRLRAGTATGTRERTASGFRWVVNVDQAAQAEQDGGRHLARDGENRQDHDQLLELIAFLKGELDAKNEQLGQALALVSQLSLPAPRSRWWWPWR